MEGKATYIKNIKKKLLIIFKKKKLYKQKGYVEKEY